MPAIEVRVLGGSLGLVAQLVRAPPCHGGGRGFKSHPGRMERKILAPGLIEYSNVFPESSDFIMLLEQANEWAAGEAAPSRYLKKDGAEMKRDVKTFFLPAVATSNIDKLVLKDWHKKFEAELSKCETDYLDYYVIDTVQSERSWLQFLKYEPGDSFSNHIDDVPESRRTLSGVYYFNDDYCNGELFFKHLDLTIKPSANSYFLFPSNWPYAHSAKEITCGIKYAMVNFLV